MNIIDAFMTLVPVKLDNNLSIPVGQVVVTDEDGAQYAMTLGEYTSRKNLVEITIV